MIKKLIRWLKGPQLDDALYRLRECRAQSFRDVYDRRTTDAINSLERRKFICTSGAKDPLGIEPGERRYADNLEE